MDVLVPNRCKWWWLGTKSTFLIKLQNVEQTSREHSSNNSYRQLERCSSCEIQFESEWYYWSEHYWSDLLYHWVTRHDWFPQTEFYDFVMNFNGCTNQSCEICTVLLKGD